MAPRAHFSLFSVRVALSLLLAAVVWGGQRSPAQAYQFQRSEKGTPVKWNKKTIVYHLHHKLHSSLPVDAVAQAIHQSAATWDASSEDQFKLAFGGFSRGPASGYDTKHPEKNQNTIRWKEKKWAYQKETIAMTFITHRRYSGEILDADIVFNGVAYRWTTSSSQASDFPGMSRKGPKSDDQRPVIDVGNTATHEFGHFLGLGHSEHKDATMFAEQSSGEIHKRILHHDDINGINALYLKPLLEESQPAKRPFSLPPPPPNSWGCSSIANEQKPSFLSVLLVLGIFLLSFGLRRP